MGRKGNRKKSARNGKGEVTKMESRKSRNGNIETTQADDMEVNKVKKVISRSKSSHKKTR